MFWVYYFEVCQVLVCEKVFIVGNDVVLIIWEGLMEMCFFFSYIYKELNVYNCCLQDYVQGVDLLLEVDKIK